MTNTQASPALRIASSIVLVRDSPKGLEVLMQRRHLTMPFAPGEVAFPGGGAEPQDLGDPRLTAVRELHEEEGITLDPAALVPLHEWITPAQLDLPRRYLVHYFIAECPADAPVPAATESVESIWVRPADAIRLFAAREMPMVMPTWWHLVHLLGRGNARTALAASQRLFPRAAIADRLEHDPAARAYYAHAGLDGSYRESRG
ncbi:NUDIX hydrolase [Leucobacter sp. HY1910]